MSLLYNDKGEMTGNKGIKVDILFDGDLSIIMLNFTLK